MTGRNVDPPDELNSSKQVIERRVLSQSLGSQQRESDKGEPSAKIRMTSVNIVGTNLS